MVIDICSPTDDMTDICSVVLSQEWCNNPQVCHKPPWWVLQGVKQFVQVGGKKEEKKTVHSSEEVWCTSTVGFLCSGIYYKPLFYCILYSIHNRSCSLYVCSHIWQVQYGTCSFLKLFQTKPVLFWCVDSALISMTISWRSYPPRKDTL